MLISTADIDLQLSRIERRDEMQELVYALLGKRISRRGFFERMAAADACSIRRSSGGRAMARKHLMPTLCAQIQPTPNKRRPVKQRI